MMGTGYLIEAICRTLLERKKTNIDLGTPEIGSVVGKCINCGMPVRIRQPWLSKMEEVNDGYYLIHCSNEDCHNYSGMEIRLDDLYLIDFAEWDERYIIKDNMSNGSGERNGIIVPFERDHKLNCLGE